MKVLFNRKLETNKTTSVFSLLAFLSLCLLRTSMLAQSTLAYHQPPIQGDSYASGLLLSNDHASTQLAAGDNIGFLFSMAISLDGLNVAQIPPLSLYFEKGIKDFMTIGAYAGYSRWDLSGLNFVGYGGRAIGYVFPIISKIAGNEVGVKNLHPYVGVIAGNLHLIYDSNVSNSILGNISTFDIGVVAGARYNFLPGMGVMLEVGQNFMQNYSLTAGLTFGK